MADVFTVPLIIRLLRNLQRKSRLLFKMLYTLCSGRQASLLLFSHFSVWSLVCLRVAHQFSDYDHIRARLL